MSVSTGSRVFYRIYRQEKAFLPDSTGFVALGEPLNVTPIAEEFYLDSAARSRNPPRAETRYYYALTALDSQGNTSVPAFLEVFNSKVLLPPSGIEVQSGDGTVTLRWLPTFSGGEQGIAGYRVFRANRPGEPGQPLFADPMLTETYQDRGGPQGLTLGASYYYTLVSQDRAGKQSSASEPILAVPYLAAGVPTQVSASSKTDDRIELSWSPPAAGTYPVKGYNIYRSQETGNAQGPINKELVIGAGYIDSEISSTSKPILGTNYTYVVRAVDEKGNESPGSEKIQATPRPPLEIPNTGLLSTSIPGLPPESSLTITGRKKIDMGYTLVTPDDRYPSLTSGLKKGFNLAQELQVRLQGKVGKKITVDVDYDDTTQEQRKISIIYAGDPNEAIQEAAFGDILLDLPRTEFAGYNKNLFGAKLKIGLDRFRFTAIGAQTKGISVTERFKGNTSPRILDIQDVSFVAFKYYYLTQDWPNQVNHPDLPVHMDGDRHGIVAGSVKVYVTDGKLTVDTVRVVRQEGGNSRELQFNLQSAGIDYTVDYDRGVLAFTNAVQSTWLIAVAYKYKGADGNVYSVGYTGTADNFDFSPAGLQVPADGKTSNSAHLLQDFTSSASVTNVKDYRMMIMNRYSFGYQNILDPQSDPDFLIKIYTIGGQELPLPQPSDSKNAQELYSIDSNFVTIQFRYNYPFQGATLQDAAARFRSNTYDSNQEDSYNPLFNTRLGGANDSLANKVKIHLAFKNVITSFQLAHYNILKNSEIIKKDGLRLQRNVDYYLDYDSGYITFTKPENIASSTEITISYEYLPFGGKFQNNLFGARAEYDLIEKKLSVGSTFLYSASQEPLDIPDVASTPNSLSLFDGDAKLTLDPTDFDRLLSPFVGEGKVPLTVEVAAEGAYSRYDINTYNKAGENSVAMLDSMEGADNLLALPLDNNIWFAASAPEQLTAPETRDYISQSVVYETGRIPVNADDKKNQLRWAYNQLTSGKWDGFVYPLSTSGSNLHDYRFLEISVYSSGTAPVTLNFDLGLVSEDSNGNGQMNFEGNGVVLNPQNNLPGDVGIANFVAGYDTSNQPVIQSNFLPGGGYAVSGIYPLGAPAGYWGEGNNRLNTEDLDNNGQLDTTRSYYEYPVTINPGWNYVKIPLAQTPVRALGNIPPTVDTQSQQFLSFVKHARMWLTGATSTPVSGYVQFETIQLSGNKWQPSVKTGTRDLAGNLITQADPKKFNSTTVSLETDSSYQVNTNFFNYDQNNKDQEIRKERSLQLNYNLNRWDVVSPESTTITPEPAYSLNRVLTGITGSDYSAYRYLRLDVFKKTSTYFGEVLFVRLGTDANNYYQYNFNLDKVPVNAWTTLILEMDGSDGNRTEHFSSAIIPGLNRVQEISLGVYNPNSFGADEILWINNLRITDAAPREGPAYRVSTRTKLSDIFTVTTENRDVDSDFFAVDEQPAGKQHVTSSQVNASITKFSFLPMNFTWSRQASFTEDIHKSNPAFSNNFSLPDTTTETLGGDLAYNQLSGLDLSLHASQTERSTDYLQPGNNHLIYNVSNENRTAMLNPRISYSLPDHIFGLALGNSSLTGNLNYTDDHTVYDPAGVSLLARSDLWDRWKHSWQESYSYQGSYSPLPFINISPRATYDQTKERGFLSWYRFYGDLNPYSNSSNLHYFSDAFKITRINRVAGLGMNLMNLPVFTPSLNYSYSNNRDYMNDSLSVPGSLSLQSGIALGDLVGIKSLPNLNFSQSYTVSATYRTDSSLTGSSGASASSGNASIENLDFKTLWLINPFSFREANALFDAAYLNSKSVNENWSTSINLLADVTLGPQYNSAWTRNMNSPGNFSTTQTNSLGSNLIWSRIPFLENWVTLQSLTLDYRFSENKSFSSTDQEVSRNTTHTTNLTLPFRFSADFNGTLATGAVNSTRRSGVDLNALIFENEYTASCAVYYNLRMVDPIRLPDFWPFNGVTVKIQQALRLGNTLSVDLVRNSGVNLPNQDRVQNKINNDTSVDYSLWKNVTGNIKLTNQWFQDFTTVNKDYYALGFSLGLSANF